MQEPSGQADCLNLRKISILSADCIIFASRANSLRDLQLLKSK